MHRRIRLVAVAVLASLSVASLFGAVVTKLSDDAFTPLRRAAIGRKIVLDRLPIYDNQRSTIELEEFQLWADDAKVVIHGDNGVVLRTEDPRPMRFFRGTVNGDPESFAYFSIDSSSHDVYGLVVTKDRRFSIATQRRRMPGRAVESSDDFLTTFDGSDAIPTSGKTWECSVEEHSDKLRPAPTAFATSNSRRVAPQGISGTQSYAIKVEVETDFELYQSAGSNATTLQTYVANLSGAVASIYIRPPTAGGLSTNLTLGNVHVYTTSSDPWSTKSPSDPNATMIGLGEVGNHYAGTRTTSNVVFLSGQAVGGGVAWTYVIGGNDFSNTCAGSPCNGGPYAWCGDINVGAVPDPNSTTNGRLYGMPTNDYWPLAEYAHELGHNLAGTHTHCVAITDTERIAAGFTDGSPANASSNFVDHCYANERQSGCYGGLAGLGAANDYLAGSQSVFTGTIMSYCHNVFVGPTFIPQSRYTFGLPTEPSHHEIDDYMMNAAGPLNVGFGNNIVTGVGSFTISAITAPASVVAGSTGKTASITAIPGATYDWSITPASAGTITSGTNSNSITWTAGSAGTATIRASAYSGTTRVGVSDAKTVLVTSGCAIVMSPSTGSTIGVVSGAAFSRSITSSGGSAPYTYTFTGTLPAGLTLPTTGVLSGTTTQTGDFPIVVTSTDTAACSSIANYTIHVGVCASSGDVNGDGVVNAADIFYLINNLFAGGPPPPSATCADPNKDSTTSPADIFYLINYLFAGGAAPK